MRVARRSLAACVLAVLALTACSTEQRSTPAPTFAPTTTTTTLPATTTTTTAPSTTTTTTTSTTVPPSTLVPPGPPVAGRVELFVGGAEADVGWLGLGAWNGSGWVDDVEPPAAGTPTRVISRTTGVRQAEFGASAVACFDAEGPTIAPDRPAVEPPGFGYGYLAVGGDWPLHPRPTVVVDTEVPRYRALAEQLLADEPVDPSDGTVRDLLLADLDADGTEEAIFVFEHVQGGNGLGTPGDFSMLVLVDTTSATPAAIFTSVVPPLPPATSDPETGSTIPQVPELLDRARVLDIADLNGDGRMELITRTWYFEGSAVQVTTYRDRSPNTVLEAGCGT